MRQFVRFALVVGLACYALPASAEDDYWSKIGKMMQEADEAITHAHESAEARTDARERAEAFRKYVESLTAEQLIVAGRDCAREIQDAIDSGRPSAGEGVIALAFFFESYPRASNDLRNIGPILQEIRDKTEPVVWRSELTECVLDVNDPDDWSEKLTNDQRGQVFDCVEQMLNDKTDSIRVRVKIPSLLTHMLSKMYKEYRDAARGAAPNKQPERKKALAEFTQRVDQYIDNSLKLFVEPTTPTAPLNLRESLLAGAMACYREGLPGSGRVKDVVVQAFGNYQDYPESLWPALAAYAIEDLEVANANDILDQMIRQASDGKPDSVKDQLQYRKHRSSELEAIRKQAREENEKQ